MVPAVTLAALLALPLGASRLGALADPAAPGTSVPAAGLELDGSAADAMMPIEVVARVADGGTGMVPNRVPAVSAAALALVVTGDGTPRTLAIPGVVGGEAIAPHGDTVVRFAVPDVTGERPILLDGRSVASLVVRPWVDPDR